MSREILKVAMHEARRVLEKHDIGGVVSLQDGLGNGEFGNFFDTPSWSMLRFLPPGKDGSQRIHLKLKMKSDPDATSRTVNMLYNCQGVLGHCFMSIEQIKTLLSEHVIVEEDEPPTVFTQMESQILEDAKKLLNVLDSLMYDGNDIREEVYNAKKEFEEKWIK